MSNATNLSALHNIYRDFNTAHPRAAAEFRDAMEDVLLDAGLTYDRVSARVKSWSSLKAKAKKRNAQGELAYPDPWRDIHDIIGVRITTFHSTEIPQVKEVLADNFVVLRSVDKAAQTRISGSFGYGSHHLILAADERTPSLASYQGLQFEVQIRTVLQHAWAEFEHDIRYKRRGPLDPQVDRAFTLAAGLIELADQQFDQIAAVHEPADAAQGLAVPELGSAGADITLTAATLPGVITMLTGNRFPQSRSEHYGWLEEILNANGITTAGQLRELLNEADIAAVSGALKYQFTPGHVRIIDDLLLHRFRELHIERTGNTGKRPKLRADRLAQRLQQLRG
ncbi:GTP pyrophosphokinase [Corynebacterium kozikiae]|uniref:GTP pyrophosphokinase n=1 Tax=Corynebacterium kozikiae TaxID=2968469 RepID=UPI00211CAE29|nr:GTP pyrophosphokinase family protein [Corynebacterium sp. 76QC2CO]MCQ9342316.1 GTP pyrophosphokinase family protein [Corynebacterium sp. 76QC2CO]